MSESKNWKEEYEALLLRLKEKEQTLKEYQQAVHQSNELMKEVMDKLSAELKMAHQIHRILLPVDLPIIPNCEFSFKFRPADTSGTGKDFYEVFPHSIGESFSIIMSSCSSHSLSALLFSTRLKMMNRGRQINQLKPHEFMQLLVKEIDVDISNLSQKGIKPLHPLEDKIALFYGLIDQRTYEMSYCLVGDITALVQYAETGEVEELKTSHGSLVKKEVSHLKSDATSLNRKDRVILCSPGVLQCQDPNGETYPLLSLKKSLQNESASSVHEIRNRIIYELESFAQGCPSEKDQSVLVMEVKSGILKLAKMK